MASYAALSVSALLITLTAALAQVGRRLVELAVNDPVGKLLLTEILSTLELCACCFELAVVAEHYGLTYYSVALFILTIWWSKSWGVASATPCTYLEEVAEKQTIPRIALMATVAQMVGGALSFPYVKFLWRLEIAVTHEGLAATNSCDADLQVSVLNGFFIEVLATCIGRLASRTLSASGRRFAGIVDAFVGTALVAAAFHYSGGYFNPVLATSLKFNCRGHTAVEHIMVYWIGAFFGTLASVYLYRRPLVRKMLLGRN